MVFVCRMQDTVVQNLMSWDSWAFWFFLSSAIAWFLRHSVTFVTLCQPMWDKVRVSLWILLQPDSVPASPQLSSRLHWTELMQVKSSHSQEQMSKNQAPCGRRKRLERAKKETFVSKGVELYPTPAVWVGSKTQLKLITVWQVLWVWGTGKRGRMCRNIKQKLTKASEAEENCPCVQHNYTSHLWRK